MPKILKPAIKTIDQTYDAWSDLHKYSLPNALGIMQKRSMKNISFFTYEISHISDIDLSIFSDDWSFFVQHSKSFDKTLSLLCCFMLTFSFFCNWMIFFKIRTWSVNFNIFHLGLVRVFGFFKFLFFFSSNHLQNFTYGAWLTKHLSHFLLLILMSL